MVVAQHTLDFVGTKARTIVENWNNVPKDEKKMFLDETLFRHSASEIAFYVLDENINAPEELRLRGEDYNNLMGLLYHTADYITERRFVEDLFERSSKSETPSPLFYVLAECEYKNQVINEVRKEIVNQVDLVINSMSKLKEKDLKKPLEDLLQILEKNEGKVFLHLNDALNECIRDKFSINAKLKTILREKNLEELKDYINNVEFDKVDDIYFVLWEIYPCTCCQCTCNHDHEDDHDHHN